jgi:hypothetical protein
VTKTLERVSAKRSLQDVARACAVKQSSPLFQLTYTIRRFLRVDLGHAPVIEKFAATHRVAEVCAPIVGRVDVRHRRCDAAFGHDGVRFPEQRFANDADARALAKRFNRRSQARSARADDQHIVLVSFKLLGYHSQQSQILD